MTKSQAESLHEDVLFVRRTYHKSLQYILEADPADKERLRQLRVLHNASVEALMTVHSVISLKRQEAIQHKDHRTVGMMDGLLFVLKG